MVFGFSSKGLSHEKYEKESRIKARDVPEYAVAFFASLVCKRKMKWYRETGIERTSIEAKCTLSGQKDQHRFHRRRCFRGRRNQDIRLRGRSGRFSVDLRFAEGHLKNTPSTWFSGSIPDQPVPCSPIFTINIIREGSAKH